MKSEPVKVSSDANDLALPETRCAYCGNTHLHAFGCPSLELLPSFAHRPEPARCPDCSSIYPREHKHGCPVSAANRWVDITDPVGRDILGRAGDIKARIMLLGHAEALYSGPGISAENAAIATLMHACDYLRDHIGYEMEPHPVGMIRLIDPHEPGAEPLEVLVREEDVEAAQ